jgi:hypothetical protein
MFNSGGISNRVLFCIAANYRVCDKFAGALFVGP